MKITLMIAVLAVLLGAAVGVGSSVYEYNRGRSYGFSKPLRGGQHHAEVSSEAPTATARLEVVGPREFDFGVMSKEETRSHTFIVKNIGSAPLTLQFLEKSCQCTDVEMTRSIVPPNESTEVKLSWRPNNYGLDFNQIARFSTNDLSLQELDLTIKGRVQQIVRPVPASLSFEGARANQATSVQLVVFGYRDDDLQIDEVEFLNAGTSEFFEATVEPLDSARIANEPGAKSGVAVTLTLKPGLPIGTFSQRLRLRTNQADLEPIDLPIQGSVVGNISIFGSREFDIESGVLELNVLSGKQEHQRKLFLIVRGEDSAEIELKVAETDPSDVLQASLEAPTQRPGRKMYPLSIRITPNGQLVDRSGSKVGPLGRIVIESNRPDAPKLNLYVSFRLEESP